MVQRGADAVLGLNVDEVLTTTRAVRRRLDFERPVARETLLACIEIAVQAPSGGNHQGWRWVLVSDAAAKRAIAERYRRFYALYREQRRLAEPSFGGRMLRIADAFAANLERAPWLVIPCIEGPMGRAGDGAGTYLHANTWASIYPAVWSFMLALRERGLGSAWTTIHLLDGGDAEAAELLGIPHDRVTQAGLFPIAYTVGTDFKLAPRLPAEELSHWDEW